MSELYENLKYRSRWIFHLSASMMVFAAGVWIGLVDWTEVQMMDAAGAGLWMFVVFFTGFGGMLAYALTIEEIHIATKDESDRE